MTEELTLFFVLSLIAEILGTLSGFGSSVLFVPIAAYFFDFHTVLGITALFHIFSNISKLFFFRKAIDWKTVLWIGLPAVIFVSLGAFLSNWIDVVFLESALAVFLISFSILFMIFQRFKLYPHPLNMAIGGSLSGFLAGLVGTGGAIRGMLLAAFSLQKDVFIATSAFVDFGVDLSRGIIYVFNGFVKIEHLPIVFGLLIVSIAGTYTGKLILEKINEKTFRYIVLFMILGVGSATLVKQFL
jgi:uncharacterized membrane protein YfcA